MTHTTRVGTELVRLGDSDFVSSNPADDLRGRGVYDPEGQRMGDVEELYIDRQEREVRFLEVGAGGFLGLGGRRFLVPVAAVTRVTKDRVTVEPGRTEKVGGPVPFDTKVAPPRADSGREDYASPPYDDVEDRVDRLGGDRSTLGYGRWPYGY